MKPLLQLIETGGPAMLAIIALSIALYARCFQLLLTLRESHRRLRLAPAAGHVDTAFAREELLEWFRQQRIALGAMIAAAPLLGLLGTVSGMTRTFESLSAKTGGKSMEGLARGISEVLVATESGLLVALPGLLFLHFAHREVRRLVARSNQLDPTAGGILP